MGNICRTGQQRKRLIWNIQADLHRCREYAMYYMKCYNITDNAIRYTPDGGDVKIFVGKLNGKPYFRVEDNGIGIPESEQQRIFERFYRVDKSHSRETGD